MKLYTCIDHIHHWPVGVASVVLAENENQARELLVEALTKQGFSRQEIVETGFTLDRVPLTKPTAIVLHDGDY